MIFEITDVIEQIHRAQRRADRLRKPQAIVIRGNALTITTHYDPAEALEVCLPCDCEVCA